MRKTLWASLYIVLVTALLNPVSSVAAVKYNFTKSTPVGSWQVREETFINHKGKKRMTRIKTSLVGKEARDGTDYYWIEMDTQSYKFKKDKYKRDGDRAIVKALVDKTTLSGDFANVIQNLRGFGKEIIIKVGDQPPMMISEGGALAQMMMKATGVEISYDFKPSGSDTVSIPAGTFKTQKISGTGSTVVNMIIKKLKIKSESTTWVSDKMPFGIVKSTANNTVNGKQETMQAVVVKFGKSGAATQITEEPQGMPEIPNLFGG